MNAGLTIAELAKQAKQRGAARGTSRWSIRRKLLKLDRLFPELHILAGTEGSKRPVGMYQVNARAYVECLSLIAAQNTHDQILKRLDLHEGISRGFKIRLKRLERRIKRIEGPQEK